MTKYTDLKAVDRKVLSEVLPLHKPFTVLIEPSSFQSLKSPSYFSKNRANMPLELFDRALAQLVDWPGAKHKVLKLCIYGEPLINPDFSKMLSNARRADIAERIETTTNASQLTRSISEALVEQQLDYLRVSIYAVEQAKHEAVTGSKVDFREIHRNISLLQEIKRTNGSCKPFISCKMLDSYSSDNDAFLRFYGDVADEVYIDKPHSWIKVDGADFLGSYYGDTADAALSDVRTISSPRIACPMPFTTMAVRVTGDVSPCCVDFVGGTNLGHIRSSTLQTLWESHEWFQFQKMQLEGRQRENSSCARCDIYKNNHYTRDNIDGFPASDLLYPKRPGTPDAATQIP